MERVRVAVIGGGIVGLCAALALQRAGWPVVLIDPEDDGASASWGNAGHIAIEQAEPIASPATLRQAFRRLTPFGGPLGLPPAQVAAWAPFAMRLARASTSDAFERGKHALSGLLASAMPAWRRLAASLPDADLLREAGHIVAWHDPHKAERGVAAWQAADTGTAQVRLATPTERSDLGAVMRQPPAAALVFTNTGQVTDPAAVIAALRAAFADAGGLVLRGIAASVAPSQAGADVILDDGRLLGCERVLIAGGVRSGRLLTSLGMPVPIIAERGYHIQAARHRWPSGLPPIVFEERSTIVTPFRSGLRMAGFVEFGGIDAPANPQRWRRLERHARDLGLPIDGPVTRWSGPRPTLPDYLPAIGRVPQAPAIFYAFGHQHLGLTLAPSTAEIIAAAVQDRPTPMPLHPFALERFGRRRSERGVPAPDATAARVAQ